MRTAARRTIFIAAAIGLVVVLGWVAERRYAARAPTAAVQAKPAADQPRNLEPATNGLSLPPSTPVQFEASAPVADPTALKPVVIGTVKPWTEIAHMPAYVEANFAERMTVRDLYWHTCVEAKIPLEHRTSAYWQFVRSWERSETGAPEAPTRTTSGQILREQQARVPSPVDAATMERWCSSSP